MRSILATTPKLQRDHFADSRLEDDLSCLEETKHYSTADHGPCKNPIADDLELRSIPTDVELMVKGNFDDLGHN